MPFGCLSSESNEIKLNHCGCPTDHCFVLVDLRLVYLTTWGKPGLTLLQFQLIRSNWFVCFRMYETAKLSIQVWFTEDGEFKRSKRHMELEDHLCCLLVYSSHQATINVAECSHLCWPSHVLKHVFTITFHTLVNQVWTHMRVCAGLVLGSTKIHSS